MPPPDVFVMSEDAAGPLGDRRPAGTIHGVRRSFPPTHTTLCGRAHALYLFADLPFSEAAGERCDICEAALEA